MSSTQRTWIYSKTGESKIIELKEGASPPDGWAFEPSGTFKGAEVPSESQSEQTDAPPLNPDTSEIEKRLSHLEEAVGSLLERISNLEVADLSPQVSSKEHGDGGISEERQRLITEAADLGIKVTSNWKDETIQLKIDEALAAGPDESGNE